MGSELRVLVDELKVECRLQGLTTDEAVEVTANAVRNYDPTHPHARSYVRGCVSKGILQRRKI